MTSLINIPSDMRRRINERLYTTQLCIEHTGMPNPGPAEIRKFKESWDGKYCVPIKSITHAQKILKEQEVPPLLYDIRTNNWDWAGTDVEQDWWADTYGGTTNRYVTFFAEEDYVLFKLLYKNS